ncbi:MAG: zf-HC2 domain-containing protein [Armatimonadota bacterium]|nr:zf-HC2 domain-containing protein [Armatimonadota bacterium]
MNERCREIRELLAPLVDGELDARRRKIVAAHLLACSDCSERAGEMMAAKRLVEREAPSAEAVPEGFHSRLQARLDQADGEPVRARSVAAVRRLVGIAAVGAIAISIAFILSTVYFMGADRALELTNLHYQHAGVTGPFPPDGYATVSCNPWSERWVERRTLPVTVDGLGVAWTIYHVGSCPVSVVEGPRDWHPYRTGWLVTERVGGFDIREVGETCMTSWTSGDNRIVLIAVATPQEVADMAAAYRDRRRSSAL